MEGAGVSSDVDVAAARGQAPLHFTISNAAALTDSGWTAKLDANMAALRLLKALHQQDRKATADEQQILAKYIGWGHTNLAPVVDQLADRVLARDPRVQQARQELEQLLTKKELAELAESTANAHYSFSDLPRAMWDVVQRLGFKGGAILEPAVGTGHFFGTMPGEIIANKRTRLFGVDKEPIAAAIAAQLYQDAHIQNSPLQEAVLPDNYFDLAISNVPFGKIAIFDPAFVSGDRAPMTRSIHNYFFAKALDVVRPGGLVVFITSRYTMDSQNDGVRQYLAARAKLLGAFRLPDASFKGTAGTEVVTDVIILQRFTKAEALESAHMRDYAKEYEAAKPADRKNMNPPVRPDWIESKERHVKGRNEWEKPTFHVNEYYHRHKNLILGQEDSSGKMARTNEPQYNVTGEAPLKVITKAIDRMNLPADAYSPSLAAPRKIALEKPADGKQGSFVVEKGKLFLYDKGTLNPSDLKGKSLERALAFIPLRDAYQKVLDVMTAIGSDADLEKAQNDLRKFYDAFVDAHGHVSLPQNARIVELDPNGSRVLALEETDISKEKVGGRTVTVIKVTGPRRPNPEAPSEGGAAIFSQRTVRPVKEPTSADNPRDAFVQSMAWKGQVDLPYMAALTGQTEAALIDALKGEMYRDPTTQAWISKDEYLSGDVVTKLANADAAAKSDPFYEENVTALRAVQPTPLGSDEFEAPLGATWVPIDLYQQFLRDEGKSQALNTRVVNNEHRTTFYVDGYGQHEFLPAGEDFAKWAENALNGKLPTIKVRNTDGSESVDPKATEEYRQSLGQLREAWQNWWRAKVEISDKLAGIYNAMFNREAARAFDGSHVVLPNASPDIQLRPWQKNVIWRAIQSGNTLLAHAVGAGKTYAMIGISGEMKRLGFAQKPMIVVPNHLVEQWRRDYLKMYPDAKVLVPSKRDFEKKHRQRLIARIANNDWDAVILAQTQFLRIAVKTETLQAFVDEQIQQLVADGAEQLNMSAEDFEQTVSDYEDGDKDAKRTIAGRGVPRSVKDIARMIMNLRARLQKRLDQQKKDAPIVFEQSGVDALLIDEAHLFKNLFFSTSRNNIAGLRGSDAQRSQDMYLKIRLINQQSNGRNVHFATGTPVSNAMSELYTMFRYLAQPTLERLGMAGFDSWANAYAVARGEMEPTADGGYKERVRLRDWSNLRELSKLFRRFADVVLTSDLIKSGVLKLPHLKGGRPTTISIEPHPEMAAFMSNIAARVEALKTGNVDPKVDNHLKISSEASLAAIDMRLVRPTAGDYAGSRLRVAAKEIAKRYHASTDVLGAQAVFLDVGTPKAKALAGLPGLTASAQPVVSEDEEPDEAAGDIVDEEAEAEEAMDYIRGLGADRDLYSELKRLLVEDYKIPANEIAFIHQAKEPSEQGKLFQMVNEGKVRVLMASTAKGGVGMNIQKRLVALHHLDVPWRPADIEQREGRILRQGNDNPEVEILRYVTRNSFDEYRWGLLATKQGFIHQFMRGEITTMDDADPSQLDMQVAQALASGDPNVMRMLNLEREVKGLRARYTNYERKRGQLRSDLSWSHSAKAIAEGRISALTPIETAAKAWEEAPTVTMTKQGSHYGMLAEMKPRVFDWKDTESRKAFQAAIVEMLPRAKYDDDVEIGHAGPFKLFVSQEMSGEIRIEGGRMVASEKAPVISVKVLGDGLKVPIIMGVSKKFDDPEHPPDYRRSLDHLLDPDVISRLMRENKANVLAREREIREVSETLDKPFKQLDELKEKETELHALRLTVSVKKIDAAADVSSPIRGGTPAMTDAADDDDVATGGGSGGESMAAGPSSGLFGGGQTPPPPRRPSSAASAPPPTGPMPDAAGLTQERTTNIRGIVPAIRALIDPEGLGPEAKGAAGTIRHEGALSFHALVVAHEQLKAFSQRVEKLSREDAVKYWDAAEHGRSTGDAEMDAGNALLHQITDTFTQQLVALDRLKAESTIENYVGRFWSVKPDYVPDFVRRALGRRPLEGPKSFLKQRTWESFAEGIRAIKGAKERIANKTPRDGDERLANIRPATYNWVESQLAKIAEMQRVIAAERMLRQEHAAGRATKVMDSMGKKPPKDADGEDWVRLGPDGDPAFTIYGPKTVAIREAYDAKLMEGLHNFARSLGVQHVRKVAVGGNRWGYAVGASHITTKVGGPEGVLMHEIGHILDERYGLRSKWVNDPTMKKELRALADMREEGTPSASIGASRKRYLRKGEEKIANLVHAFLYMPERTKKIAPNAYWALHNLAKEHASLRPLLDLQKHGRSLKLDVNTTEQEIPGFPVVGHWYAPKAAAAVWSNHLSKGMRGNPLYDAYSTVANASAQILLGFSGFHFTTIAREGLNSRLAQSVDALANRGRHMAVGDAVRLALSAPAAAATDAAFGRRVMEEYRTPGTHPELARVLDAMMAGGFRGTAESEFWTGQRVEALKTAFRQAVDAAVDGDTAKLLLNGAKVPFDAVWAGIELTMKPLMGKYVPWMKTGATYRAVAQALAKLPKDAPLDQVHEAMWNIVKEMDFRYGQVVYDNHFVNRMVKDLAHAMFLAPGWTFGTIGLAARGLKQGAALPIRAYQIASGKQTGPIPDELVGSSAAYWIGGVLAFMFINGVLTFLHTGDAPTTAKDYFAYRDGTVDDDGNANRHVLPGYEMRDIYGWAHHPVDTLGNKLKPAIAFLYRLARNRTYFGDLIYNPEADSWTKALQLGRAAVEELGTPLSVQNYQESRHRGGAGAAEVTRNILGITPAKREFERTKAQNLLSEYIQREGHTARTPEEVENADQRRAYRDALRKGDRVTAVTIARTEGLSKRQIQAAKEAVTENYLQRGFKGLTIDHALSVYEAATPRERAQIELALRHKWHLVVEAPPDEREALRHRFATVSRLPVQRGRPVGAH